MTDEKSAIAAQARLDSLAKPLNGLGLFERIIVRLAAIQHTPDVDIGKKCVLVLCADNGVVREGVTQTDASVTRIVARKIAAGQGNINGMARAVGADVFCVDVGMLEGEGHPNLMERIIARGTDNIARGSAMSREQANEGIEIGVSLVKMLAGSGYKIVAIGEMGIGNTKIGRAHV